MEELRSTEGLDREILEDARKKADRVLRSADQEAKATEEQWGKKLKDDIAALSEKHSARVAAKRAETNARLPLDKRRLRAERAERLLLSAMENTLRSLPRGLVLGLLERDLKARADELPSAKLLVRFVGMSAEEAEAALSPSFAREAWSFADPSSFGPADSLPAIVIEGGRTTVRVGVSAAGEDLLREKRAELAASLFGMEVLDD